MSRRVHTLAAIATLAITGGVARADEVTHWIGVLQQAIRVEGGPPCPIGRSCAMVTVAMYDALNSIVGTHEPYLIAETVEAGASGEAAVAAAAHRVLVALYPEQQPMFDEELAARLALIPDGPAEASGISCGQACADHMIAHRLDDGSGDEIGYKFGGKPGDYITPEDLPAETPAFTPWWGNTRPFAMTTTSQFRPAGPLGHTVMRDLLRSPGYATQLNEVKSLGAVGSTTRTADQTALAFFWANDVDGTYKPPGHLLNITREISDSLGLSLGENARLFALVGLAIGDAAIVGWDAKYNTDIDLWRPITGIRQANTDGNPATTRDSAWLPLNAFTPPFPAYISGHSTFAGAWVASVRHFLGTDSLTFTITSEDPFFNALPGAGPRTFHRLSDAGREDALSRLYLGVHWRFDCEDGYDAGESLGDYVGRTFLRPLCPADFNLDRTLNSQDFFEYLAAFFADSRHAEFNHDGAINSQDLFDFLAAFFAGC